MSKDVVRDMHVVKVEAEPPFVRVTCRFVEGGTSSKSMTTNLMTYVVDEHAAPRVGERRILTVTEGP